MPKDIGYTKFDEYLYYQIDKTVTPHFDHNFHEFL